MEIRRCTKDELRPFFATVESVFGFQPSEEDYKALERILDMDRTLGAFDDDVMVGGGAAFSFSLTVPGGEVPTAGVTLVGVLPSHRRKGVLTSLMRRQLDDIREGGEPLAALWASEGGIYGRFGYGIASRHAEIDIERDRAAFLEPTRPEGRIRLLDHAETMKVVPSLYERVRAGIPGTFRRSTDWWEGHRLHDPEKGREGSPLQRAVWEHEGDAQAYVLYRLHSDWRESMPASWLEVVEVMAATPLAVREIWRFVFGVDLVVRIRAWMLSQDDPLFDMVAEPRRLRFRLKDGLYIRLVDLAAALEARSYRGSGALVFELGDAICPWNEGRW